MMSYLVYEIVNNILFQNLPLRKDINMQKNLVQFWYPMLWKHKAPFHIYQVQDSFLGWCRVLLIGKIPSQITKVAKYFMARKGIYHLESEWLYVRLLCFEGSPILLPKFVTNRMLVIKVCRQYLKWSIFFEKKRKRQFI